MPDEDELSADYVDCCIDERPVPFWKLLFLGWLLFA